MSKQRITINIAKREYPLTIDSTTQEEAIRLAVKSINSMVAKYEENYGIQDKQDALAMCALELASKIELTKLETEIIAHQTKQKLSKLNNILSEVLNRS
ncbi:MAG: cell division protein ZapA [Bacteroidota bacterium]|nr:cell division protein ZapA [Bacteroidota bacterium]